MLQPIYIYKFEAYRDYEAGGYIKYFILDSHKFNDSDQVNYLIRLNNYDQIFINIKANEYYFISEDMSYMSYTRSIRDWYADIDFFKLIDFSDLILLLDRIVKETSENTWKGGPKLIEMLKLIIAKWDDWN